MGWCRRTRRWSVPSRETATDACTMFARETRGRLRNRVGGHLRDGLQKLRGARPSDRTDDELLRWSPPAPCHPSRRRRPAADCPARTSAWRSCWSDRSASARWWATPARCCCRSCATSSQCPSGDTEIELGWFGNVDRGLNLLFASDITSMRLAVKLAMYRTPRARSSACRPPRRRSARLFRTCPRGRERRHHHHTRNCQKPMTYETYLNSMSSLLDDSRKSLSFYTRHLLRRPWFAPAYC